MKTKNILLFFLLVLLAGLSSCKKDHDIPTGEVFNAGDGSDVPQGAISGLFTINANGDQVYFSQGNLQYIGSANTPYWKFADNQWDVLDATTGQNSTSQTVDRDLFGWGTSGYNHGAVCYQPWSTSQTNSDYYAYGQETYNLYDQTGQADWGYNAISNGGNQANQWRTLTTNEWGYVFNTRTTSSGIRYAKANVNNVNGVILLPDDWSTSYYMLSNINNTSASFSSNTISATQWNTLEQHGAVFLPAAGYRYGTSVGNVGSSGGYWSASYGSSDYAYYVNFSDSYLYPQNDNSHYYGQSVRLVRSTDGASTYSINTISDPIEGGTVSGGGTYQQGQTCTLTADANDGFSFVNWTENGTQVSTNANYTFTVNGNRTLIAHFTSNIQNYSINVSADPSNGGTVSGGGTYQQGQTCTVHATANSGYTFTNWTEGGTPVSTNANYTFTVTGNRTLVAHFTYNGGSGNAPTGAINGLFTINANGDQVYFSQGNLQYQASTNTWRFATNQYDCMGSDNSNISSSYSGWIDLFGWGTSGYNHGAVCYQPWSTSQTYIDYYAYGQYTYNLYDQTGQADWGYNAISNGGNTTNTWRTLTGGSNGEWRYIFETRSTPSGIRYAKARVNGVNGVVLLPDDWSASYYSLSNTNQDVASFSSNVISSTQWSTLEQHGAVFLPAAGSRDGTSVGDVGSIGYYWSASYNGSNSAYRVFFVDTNLFTDYNSRNYGQSVRLVRPAEN